MLYGKLPFRGETAKEHKQLKTGSHFVSEKSKDLEVSIQYTKKRRSIVYSISVVTDLLCFSQTDHVFRVSFRRTPRNRSP